MTRAAHCTPICTCVLQPTFECLTSRLLSIRGSNNPARSPWVQISASRVPNLHRRGTRGACTENGEYEASDCCLPSDDPSFLRSFGCPCADPAPATRRPGHMVRTVAEAIQPEQQRLWSSA